MKNFIQGEINEYDHDKGRKYFSYEIYRFKIVHFLLIFSF